MKQRINFFKNVPALVSKPKKFGGRKCPSRGLVLITFPLTPALSLGEREPDFSIVRPWLERAVVSTTGEAPSSPLGRGRNVTRSGINGCALAINARFEIRLPLPKGEGWGEGKGDEQFRHNGSPVRALPLAPQKSGARFLKLVGLIALGWFALVASPAGAAGERDGSVSTPRQLYNDGTRKLGEGKLQEAEACLQGAVASQNEKVQGPALYNLGETRFREGAEELKKGPKAQAAGATSQRAYDNAGSAIQAADAALAGEDVSALVSAYMQGRGARKELKAATEAVKKAMETFGSVLGKWERASGDFKSTYELSPADGDAKTNAAVVDRSIAKLVDQQQMMMQAMSGMKQQKDELGKKLAQLKQRMPEGAGDKPKGKGDDEDDDEDDKPKGPHDGQEEPGHKDGKETFLTREEAARLLGMLKLDANRKLSLGGDEPGKPKERKGRDW